MTQHSRPGAPAPVSYDGKGPSGFPPGTTILTLDGALPVEALYPGDKVITRDAGAQPLLAIRRMTVLPDMRMVHVTRDALGGKPERDVILPAGQRVLIRDWRSQALYGTPAARVPLSRLVDGEHIRWSDTAPEALIALHFGHDHIVYADGLELFSAAPLVAAA